nr:hypothetical protein [Tanacetum cinerariifolium]
MIGSLMYLTASRPDIMFDALLATVLAGGIDVPTGSGSIPTAGPPATDISTGSEESTEKANDQEAEEGLLYGYDQKQLRVEGKRFQRKNLKG